MTKKEISRHLRHCYQGEYKTSCKYGEDNICPANPNKKHIIYGCPYCKGYLPKTNDYKFCTHCGKPYNKEKLIILDII